MSKLFQQTGYTLLEIIVVIIIVGVLASLALPRFFATIEYAHSTEALTALTTIRGSMERCYVQRFEDYANCTTFTNLDVGDPGNAPNAHFSYSFLNAGPAGYSIVATRNTRSGGNAGDTITLTQTTADVTRTGTGAFQPMH